MTTWHFKPSPRRAGSALTWFQSWLVLNGGSRFEAIRRSPHHPGRAYRNAVAVAARRSGKTVGLRNLVIQACLDTGPGDVGYMAPTLGQAKRLLWRPLMQDLRDPRIRTAFLESKPNHSELTVEFKTGVRLYLYSAEAFERVRGDGFKLFATDETDDPLFSDEVFDEAIYPALSDNLGTLVQVGTPKGRGRLFREFRKGQPGDHHDPDYASIQVTALEAGIIDRSEVERAYRTRPTRAFEQEYLATFNAPIGLVYDEWNEARHVVTAGQLPQFDEIIVGVDWGVAKRGAMVVIGIDRAWFQGNDEYEGEERPRVWVLEDNSERMRPYSYSTDVKNPGWWTIAQRIQREWQPSAWYFDPAGGTHEEHEARAAGYGRQLADAVKQINPRARVVPADNKVSPGISAVADFMHYDDVLREPPRFFVLDTCKVFRDEVGQYRWANAAGSSEEDPDGYDDKPVKKNDHVMDACRYGVFSHFYSKRKAAGRNHAGFEERGG